MAFPEIQTLPWLKPSGKTSTQFENVVLMGPPARSKARAVPSVTAWIYEAGRSDAHIIYGISPSTLSKIRQDQPVCAVFILEA